MPASASERGWGGGGVGRRKLGRGTGGKEKGGEEEERGEGRVEGREKKGGGSSYLISLRR